MYYFLAYATIAYTFMFIITLIRLAHFFYKFRICKAREVANILIILFSPALLFSLLTFPIEIVYLIRRRTVIDRHYAYQVACAAFDMKYDQLHWGYRIRKYEWSDLDNAE